MLIAFHKPYDVLSQFTRELPTHRTLADFSFPKNVYPIGRLDRDSEGLLLLSDEKNLVDRLLNPKNEHPRTYWVQVEGVPDDVALEKLCSGSIVIEGHRCARARVEIISPPEIAERIPPIRHRATIPTTWIALTLTEGKNRQVRKMTAAAGHPTLRLVRAAIGKFPLLPLENGAWKVLEKNERESILAGTGISP